MPNQYVTAAYSEGDRSSNLVLVTSQLHLDLEHYSDHPECPNHLNLADRYMYSESNSLWCSPSGQLLPNSPFANIESNFRIGLKPAETVSGELCLAIGWYDSCPKQAVEHSGRPLNVPFAGLGH